MNSKLWIRKIVSSCLMVAILATYSMVALASNDKATGELTVNGMTVNGETPIVTINGEAAKTGRTVFSSSTITTPENASAIVDMGKAGEIEVAPSSSLTISFDNASAFADLNAGSLTVLRSNQGVNVNANGASQVVPAGGTASSGAPKDDKDYRDSTGKCIDANKNGKEECDKGGAAWWLWALVFGGASVGILVAATRSSTTQLGGGGNVISPSR